MKRVIVHGVHRSGTSLTSSLLENAGFWYGEKKVQMPPQRDNSRGFWERIDVVELNDLILNELQIDWFSLMPEILDDRLKDLDKKFGCEIQTIIEKLESHRNWFVKDPRMSFTWPLWEKYFNPTEHIVVHRNPLSVAKSLFSRNGIPIEHGVAFWFHQTRLIASYLQREDKVITLGFGMDEADGTRNTLVAVNELCLGSESLKALTEEKYKDIYDSSMVHQATNDEDLKKMYPEMYRVWKLAINGDYSAIVKLPPKTTIDFTWQDLDSRSLFTNISDRLQRELTAHAAQIKSLVKDSGDMRSARDQFQARNKSQIIEIQNLQNELESSNAKVAVANEVSVEREQLIDNLQAQVDEMSVERTQLIDNFQAQVDEMSVERAQLIDDFQAQIDNFHAQIDNFQAQIDEHNLTLLKITGELKRYMMSMRYVFPSLTTKVLSKLRLVSDKSLHHAYDMAKYGHSAEDLAQILPPVSNRRLFFSALVRNPTAFLKRLSIKRVNKGVMMMLGRVENDHGVQQGLLRYSTSELPIGDDIDIIEPVAKADSDSFDVIEFEHCAEPKVSIVIPVYNNFATTYACLKSIKKHTDHHATSFEVIIADDCSSDQTVNLLDYVKNIRVIRGEENLGFLRNCNHAIPKALGEFIVLLNNDTNTQEKWLSELLKPIQDDLTIGITGSMFIYPDGRLQEAGGIIFSDASGWNYGRFDQPDKPEYNFARDVDYISGACLLFRKSLWTEIGGFDEQFAPAYYEDSDFCFETRKRGLRVRFVPTSRIVHFEGVSHGRDEDSGIKRYQGINRDKFEVKWRSTLQSKHYSDSSYWFRARNHGRHRKTVLVVDHYVPMYDKDAGSRTIFMYIQLMLEEGHHVIFMGDNFYPHEPYTTELKAMGVEVLYGSYYQENWFEWLTEHQAAIDCIFFNRPHITTSYIDKIRSLEKTPRVVYYGLDLHFVRVERERQLGIKNESGKSVQEWRDEEMNIMHKSDVVLYPGEFELATVKAIDPDINVHSLPIYWFEDEYLNKKPETNDSENLLFVGGFGHPPNQDGLIWFLNEVFPIVLQTHPNALLTIIGSKCPDDVFSLASNNIKVLGEVSDAVLDSSYKSAKIAVVPLRYGAGVKGKVIEAMSKGVPVVTTNVGAEGLPENPSSYLCVDDASEMFAKNITVLLEKPELCFAKSEASYTLLSGHYSRAAALAILDNFFV